MSAGFSDSESEQQNSAEYNQSVFNPDAYTSMYNDFSNLFGSTLGMQSLIPGSSEFMGGVTDTTSQAWEDQLAGGVYGGLDLTGAYNEALTGGGNEQFVNEIVMGGAGNDYVDALSDQMSANAFDSLGKQYAAIDNRAANSGMSGSSRQGIMQSQAYEDTADALLQSQTQLGYDSFSDNLDRMLGIAQNADAYDMGVLENTSGMLAAQDATTQNALNFGSELQNLDLGSFAPYLMPWLAADSYSSAVGSPTVLGSGFAGGSAESDSMSLSGGK